MDPNEARNLYIYLGSDSIFRLNLVQLLLSSNETKVEEVLLSTESKYPPFKGLIVMKSKLHCIGDVVGKLEEKVFSFNLPTLTPDHSTHFPCYHSFKSRPNVFTTISNKVYALETTLKLDRPNSFEVFDHEIGEWKSLPPPPQIPLDTFTLLNSAKVFDYETGEWKSLPPPTNFPLHTLTVFRNNILLQTCYGDYIFDVNADRPNWEKTDKLFPRIFAALEYKGFLFVLSKKPYKLVVYELASFGESNCTPRVLDIWSDRCLNCIREVGIHWASLNLVGNNLICIVLISNNKIHVTLIRFMETFVYAKLVACYEFYVPESKKSSDISLYSTFIWGTDISCHETVENPINSIEHLTKDDQIEDYSMDHKQVRYLYIYLGFGALLSLKFNEPCNKDNSSFLDPKSELRMLFSHHNKGAEFPAGMGLFAWGSKVHFFGGENLEVFENEMLCEDMKFYFFSEFIGLKSGVLPRHFKYEYEFKDVPPEESEPTDDCFNQKVFCYDLPYFTPCDPPRGHSGWKFRPLVFTISNKIYALSTRTVSSINISRLGDNEGKLKLFEVFEPEKNEWHHIDLDKLPSELCDDIIFDTLKIESHCVFRDQMLLQTDKRDYVFDSLSEDWDNNPEMWYPRIHCALEYNNKKLLLVISRYPVELLVYELASFGKKDCTFGRLDILDKEKKTIDFFGELSYLWGASLNLIDPKHVSLVLFTEDVIRVSVFNVEWPFRYAKLEADNVFDVPNNCLWDIQPYSTFLLHEDNKAADPREEISTVGEPEGNQWELFKKHLDAPTMVKKTCSEE